MSVFFRPSAGAVVIRSRNPNEMLVLDQVRKNGERQTVAPKGGIEPDESVLEAGFREVREETGLTGLALLGYLGQQRFSFNLDDGRPGEKTVDWFLMQATDDDALTPGAAEGFGAGRWLSFAEARRNLSHPAFISYVDKAERLVSWRTTHQVKASPNMDRAVTEFAREAHGLCADAGSALVLCGSAARGDYVPGWSDLDFVAFAGRDGPGLAARLARLSAELESRCGIHVAARVGDLRCREMTAGGALYDMKLRAVARRIGIDSVLLGGHRLGLPGPMPAEDLTEDLDIMVEAARQLLSEGGRTRAVRDSQRRTMSVMCSASRLVAAAEDPLTSFLLTDVAALIERNRPDQPISRLLRHYDSVRTLSETNLTALADLALAAPEAIEDLRDAIAASPEHEQQV